MFSVSNQVEFSFEVIGILPFIKRSSLTFQNPKLGIETITLLPILVSSVRIFSGSSVAWIV